MCNPVLPTELTVKLTLVWYRDQNDWWIEMNVHYIWLCAQFWDFWAKRTFGKNFEEMAMSCFSLRVKAFWLRVRNDVIAAWSVTCDFNNCWSIDVKSLAASLITLCVKIWRLLWSDLLRSSKIHYIQFYTAVFFLPFYPLLTKFTVIIYVV